MFSKVFGSITIIVQQSLGILAIYTPYKKDYFQNMKKFFKVLFFIFLFMVVGVIGVGYYFYSQLSRPKNLGIVFSEQAYKEGLAKTGTTHKALAMSDIKSPTDRFVRSGKHTVTTTFTSQEITSACQRIAWVDFPFSDVQVKINSDGTGESTGLIKMSKIYDFAQALGFSKEQVDKAKSTFNVPSIDIPYYIKASGGVVDNKVSFELKDLNLYGVTVPANIISQASPAAEIALQQMLNKDPSVTIKKLELQPDKVYFDGTFPNMESTLDSL